MEYSEFRDNGLETEICSLRDIESKSRDSSLQSCQPTPNNQFAFYLIWFAP